MFEEITNYFTGLYNNFVEFILNLTSNINPVFDLISILAQFTNSFISIFNIIATLLIIILSIAYFITNHLFIFFIIFETILLGLAIITEGFIEKIKIIVNGHITILQICYYIIDLILPDWL